MDWPVKAYAGLTLFVTGFLLLPQTTLGGLSRGVLATGGALSAMAAYIFVYNVWRTIDGRRAKPIVTADVSGPAVQAVLRRSSGT